MRGIIQAKRLFIGVAWASIAILSACGSKTAGNGGTGGKATASGSGGNPSGPSPSTGTGGAASPSSSGGAPATPASGGAPSTAGTGGATDATGGAPATGGSGGAPSTTGTGGATAGAGGRGGAPAAAGTGGSPAGSGGATSGDASVADGPAADTAPAPVFSASFHIGADITWVQHDEFYGATYVDTDGVQKDILALLKNHGFNSVRLRTFVNPKAADGYDVVDGFGDTAHTVAMGQRIKQAGMGFLLSVHLSDNWADPGKQCIPVAWQQDTFAQLTTHVHDYMFGLVTALKAAGAMPDLIQIGNEITSGVLIHTCGAGGVVMSVNAVNGRITNWVNLGTLLKAGIQGVREVDTTVKTVLHIDRGGDLAASIAFINNARSQNVPFDVFADTSYVRWQGQPSGWQNTFNMLSTMFPTLSFIIPEYGNETATAPATPSTMRIANDIMFNIPNRHGLGTWIYEPEHPVQAGIGIGLFRGARTDAGVAADNWPVFPAEPVAMSVYDQMRTAYAGRL